MAVGDTYTDLGLTTKIAVGKPATEDQLGYGALSWIEWGCVVSLPQRGDTVEDIAEPCLSSGRNEHFGGMKDGGILEIPFKFVEGDAGQALVRAAAGTNDVYSIQEVDIDGTATFYYGRFQAVQRRESTTSSNKGYIAMFAVNSDRFTGTEEV